MHARIAYFEGARADQVETARRLLEEQFVPRMKELRGFAGHLQLGQADAGTAMGVALFTGEEELREGDKKLSEMSPPDELEGIRRTKVELYEVAIQDIEHDAQAARVSRLEGSPDRIDETIRQSQETILPEARKLEGNCGALGFVDRKSGTVVIMTLWDTMEAMQRSEEAANRLRERAADAGGQQIASVERCQVVSMQVPVGARR